MNGLRREQAPFSGRVWQEIDETVGAVRTANCTARRFLSVDGPYGLGLTSVGGDEGWLQPTGVGATPTHWNVARPDQLPDGAAPRVYRDGTYVVRGIARPVPLIASEFVLGMRAIEGFDAGSQPLDVCRATDAARDVALEEERLLYYGNAPEDQALMQMGAGNNTDIRPETLFYDLQTAVQELAQRGYAGPFALTVTPVVYSTLYAPVTHLPRSTISVPVLLVDLLRNLFRGGVFMAPVIDPAQDPDYGRAGAIITVGRSYSRLVVGQDWATAYGGQQGVLHRFMILNSLQLRICDARSIQVLTLESHGANLQNWYWRA